MSPEYKEQVDAQIGGSEFTFERLGREDARRGLDELVTAYSDVYNVAPYRGDPFFSPLSYADRLAAAFPLPGLDVVVARSAGEIAGYVYGVVLPADRPWWVSLGDARPIHLRKESKEGNVFWLRELLVRESYRRRGLARSLHDVLLLNRCEGATVLTCIIDNEPAHSAYRRWGYRVIGQIKHSVESPVYDAMFLESQPRVEGHRM